MNYELLSVGRMGLPKIVSIHLTAEEALHVRDQYLDRLRESGREETFVVTHPDVEGYVEWPS